MSSSLSISSPLLEDYSNDTFGVRIGYPQGWLLQENIGGAVVAFSPAPEDTQAPTLNVVVQDLSSNPMSLDDFTSVSLYQMEQMLQEVADVDVSATVLAGNPGKRVQYSTRMQSFYLKFFQTYTLKDDIAYIITFSAPPAIHDALKGVIEQCIEKFEITEKKGTPSLALREYHNKKNEFKLHHPMSWKRVGEHSPSNAVWEYIPKNQKDPMIRMIAHVDRVPSTFTLDDFTTLVMSQYTKAGTAAAITDTHLGGHPAKRALFSGRSLLYPGRYLHVWTIRNSRAYSVTFIHAVDAPDPDMDLYLPIFERVVATFGFTPAEYVKNTSRRYENLTHKFGLNFPNGYEVQEGFMGATVSFSTPEPQTDNNFASNINVVVQDMTGQNMNLDEFADMLRQQLNMSVEDCHILDISDTLVAGQVGRQFTYQGKISTLTIKFVQKVVITQGKAVVLSFASERPKFEAEYKKVGHYLDTFQFIDM
eukprot:TRINITY_DN2517_c0_g1_i1.p1 TRINITY_DN2517_c0_g1~~TRINITY_DN2517_c0_g1_i1.p1  ORF type:complete len:499 (-),score=143.52 TRINITY_DN2517_c0_g1_i1:640-2070(-)